MKYRKKPVVIEAITFTMLVDHGRASGAPLINGMPWSFEYAGHPITHENDACYLIPAPNGLHTLRLTPGDMLVTAEDGKLEVYGPGDFAAAYDPVEEVSR